MNISRGIERPGVWLLVLIAGGCLAGPAMAQTLYVTDILQLGLHDTEDLINPPFRSLPSGSKVEVIATSGPYTRLRTADGSIGWAKSLYLVSEKPARARLASLEQQNSALDASNKKLRSQLTDQSQRARNLEEQTAEATALTSANHSELQRLRIANQALEIEVSKQGITLSLGWLLAAIGLAIAAGFGGGWWWMDHSIRARHGGFRIH